MHDLKKHLKYKMIKNDLTAGFSNRIGERFKKAPRNF
jgi:hypothetical protein